MPADAGPRGPALVYTTRYLRRAPRRVALSTRAIALPGTYRLTSVVGVALGSLGAALPGGVLASVSGSYIPLAVLLPLGGALGLGIASWRSKTGETIPQLVNLFMAKRTGLVMIGGRWVRAYVGACRLDRAPFGAVQVLARSEEAATAAELHGEHVVSTLVRPSTRPPEPRGAALQRTLPSARPAPAAPARGLGWIGQFGAAIDDVRRQLAARRSLKQRDALRDVRGGRREAPRRSGMISATRMDSQGSDSSRPMPERSGPAQGSARRRETSREVTRAAVPAIVAPRRDGGRR